MHLTQNTGTIIVPILRQQLKLLQSVIISKCRSGEWTDWDLCMCDYTCVSVWVFSLFCSKSNSIKQKRLKTNVRERDKECNWIKQIRSVCVHVCVDTLNCVCMLTDDRNISMTNTGTVHKTFVHFLCEAVKVWPWVMWWYHSPELCAVCKRDGRLPNCTAARLAVTADTHTHNNIILIWLIWKSAHTLNTTRVRYKFIWPTHNNNNILIQGLDTQIKCGLFLSFFFCIPSNDLHNSACVCVWPIWFALHWLAVQPGDRTDCTMMLQSSLCNNKCWIPTESDTSSNKADLKELLHHHVPNAGIEVQITGSVFPVFLHFSLSLCICIFNPTYPPLYSDGAPLCCEEEMEDLGVKTVCAEVTGMQKWKKVWDDSNLIRILITWTISGLEPMNLQIKKDINIWSK